LTNLSSLDSSLMHSGGFSRPIPGLTVPSIPVHSLDLSTSKTHPRSSKKNSSTEEEERRSDHAEGSRSSGSKLPNGIDAKSKEPEKDDTVYQPVLSRKQKMKVSHFRFIL
jgi:hypothetical protein